MKGHPALTRKRSQRLSVQFGVRRGGLGFSVEQEFASFHPKIGRFALANISDSGSQFDCPSGKKSTEGALCFDKKTKPKALSSVQST